MMKKNLNNRYYCHRSLRTGRLDCKKKQSTSLLDRPISASMPQGLEMCTIM